MTRCISRKVTLTRQEFLDLMSISQAILSVYILKVAIQFYSVGLFLQQMKVLWLYLVTFVSVTCQLDKHVLCKCHCILTNFLFSHTRSHLLSPTTKMFWFFFLLQMRARNTTAQSHIVCTCHCDWFIVLYGDTMKVCKMESITYAPSVIINSTTKVVCFVILKMNTQMFNQKPYNLSCSKVYQLSHDILLRYP